MGSGRDGSPAASVERKAWRGGMVGVGTRWLEHGSETNGGDGVVRCQGVEGFAVDGGSPLKSSSVGDGSRAGDVGQSLRGVSRRGARKAVPRSPMEVDDSMDKFEVSYAAAGDWSHSQRNARGASSRGSKGDAEGHVTLGEDWQVSRKCPKSTRVMDIVDLMDQGHGVPRRPVKSPVKGRPLNTEIREEIAPVQVNAQKLEGTRRTRVDIEEMQELLQELHEQNFGQERSVRNRHVKGSRESKSDAPDNHVVSKRTYGLVDKALGRTVKSPATTAVDVQQDMQASALPRRLKPQRQKRKTPDEFVAKSSVAGRDAISTSSWLQLINEVIMWKDVPRSSFLFGAGCFFVLSASYVQDIRLSTLTLTSYLSLIYLAVVFFHRNFLRGSATQARADSNAWELSDAEALDLVRVILPATNMFLTKCAHLFSGDPCTTLKVATMLWVLGQVGYFMTLWSFVRLAFFGAFTMPRLYACYSHHLQYQAHILADRLWSLWDNCPHKKVALLCTFLLAWNLSSSSTRLFGAFVLLVTFRLLQPFQFWSEQQHIPDEHTASAPLLKASASLLKAVKPESQRPKWFLEVGADGNVLGNFGAARTPKLKLKGLRGMCRTIIRGAAKILFQAQHNRRWYSSVG